MRSNNPNGKERAEISPLSSSLGDDEESADDVIGGTVGPLPSVSSRVNFAKEVIVPKYDLWIVGAGTLGKLVAKLWKEEFPSSTVVAETESSTSHSELESLNCIPKLRASRENDDFKSARNVLICIPPSASTDYNSELSEGCRLWSGSEVGNLIFTSSTAVYGDKINGIVDETFRTDSRSSRSNKMLCAEEAVLSRGGSVMRLAGLYTPTRGPHSYWLRNGTVDSNADGVVNMLHYEDAASVIIAAIKSDLRNQIYLACDDKAETRSEICESALASKLYPTATMPKFTSLFGLKGKICNSSWTRSTLQWKPKYRTFSSCLRRIGGEIINDNDIITEPSIGEVIEKKKASASALWMPGEDVDDISI